MKVSRSLVVVVLFIASLAGPANAERVTLESEGWTLIGDWELPAGTERVPAVLLLHRAAGSRSEYLDLAEALSDRGIASLRLDLRANGESTNLGTFGPPYAENRYLNEGAWQDVNTALTWLGERPRVDAGRLGVVAASYSGEKVGEALGHGGPAAAAYVMLSPGNFSEASIDLVRDSGAPWLFLRTTEESEVSLPFIDDVFTMLAERAPHAERLVLDGAGHATHILEQHPDSVTLIADWLAQKLTAPEPAAADAIASSGLDLRIEPFPNFYFLVRAQAADVIPVEPYLQPVIDAWMPVQKQRGTFGGFWRFDVPGLESGTPAEFGNWFDDDDTPESTPGWGDRVIPIKAPGLAMAKSMESPWPRFLDEEWPERRRQLEEVRSRLERDFMPKHREALAYMLRSLGIADPEIDVPTYLALDIHPPGATTYRSSDGPVFVASTRELLSEGRFSDLEETLLHEVSHCLDLASEGDGDVFSRMRASLEERGVTRGDPRHHDVPHLVMFVQAEETMKRLYEADHVAYGDTQRGDIAPLYERHGEAAVIVRRVWGQYLDGAFDLEEAVRRIVDEVLADGS